MHKINEVVQSCSMKLDRLIKKEARDVITLANYKSVKTTEGIKIFRYDTVFQSERGPGNVVGLIYMMNPGDARPESDKLFQKLSTSEYETKGPVISKADRTMDKVIRLRG